MNKKLIFGFFVSGVLLPNFPVYGMYYIDSEKDFPSLEQSYSSANAQQSFKETSVIHVPSENSDESSGEEFVEESSEEDGEELIDEEGERNLLFFVSLEYRSKIAYFQLSKSMEKMVVQLPTEDEVWKGLPFNFASNGGQNFCEELYSQEKSLSQVLDLIVRATQKDYDRAIQGRMEESFAVLHTSTLEGQLLKLVLKNHQEVLDELDKQHQENELRQKKEILVRHWERFCPEEVKACLVDPHKLAELHLKMDEAEKIKRDLGIYSD